MLSAVIHPGLSYPAMPLARQLAHQRSVHPGPLVLGADPRNSLTPTADRDRPVSRRSEPSSRTTLMGEQTNPWDLVQPQDVMSRHRMLPVITNRMDYIFILQSHCRRWRVSLEVFIL